jgi:hypothetical protein
MIESLVFVKFVRCRFVEGRSLGHVIACIDIGLSYFTEIGSFVRFLPMPEGKSRVQLRNC